jgi:hypothetical protein
MCMNLNIDAFKCKLKSMFFQRYEDNCCNYLSLIVCEYLISEKYGCCYRGQKLPCEL